jgi:hypothetical protein
VVISLIDPGPTEKGVCPGPGSLNHDVACSPQPGGQSSSSSGQYISGITSRFAVHHSRHFFKSMTHPCCGEHSAPAISRLFTRGIRRSSAKPRYTSHAMGDEDAESRKDEAWATLCQAEGWACRVCGCVPERGQRFADNLCDDCRKIVRNE